MSQILRLGAQTKHSRPSGSGLASPRTSSSSAASRRHIHACPRLTTQCVVQNYPHANARLSHSATAAKQRGAHDTAIDVADDRPARRGRDAHSRTDHNRREYDDVEGDGEDKGEIDPRFAAHLNRLFLPLEFPPELAQRLLTHGSHKAAARGHNARFSFLGRRLLEAYLFLFLSSHPHDNDHAVVLERTLNTYLLGEHVAPKWRLERVVRWAPTIAADRLITRAVQSARERDGLRYIDVDRGSEVPSSSTGKGKGEGEGWVDVRQLGMDVVRSVGMHKVHGDIVQGIMGGIYHQFGGAIAHRIFHTRVLPRVLLTHRSDGLPDSLHPLALKVCERMGGINGPLPLLTPANSGKADRESKNHMPCMEIQSGSMRWITVGWEELPLMRGKSPP